MTSLDIEFLQRQAKADPRYAPVFDPGRGEICLPLSQFVSLLVYDNGFGYLRPERAIATSLLDFTERFYGPGRLLWESWRPQMIKDGAPGKPYRLRMFGDRFPSGLAPIRLLPDPNQVYTVGAEVLRVLNGNSSNRHRVDAFCFYRVEPRFNEAERRVIPPVSVITATFVWPGAHAYCLVPVEADGEADKALERPPADLLWERIAQATAGLNLDLAPTEAGTV